MPTAQDLIAKYQAGGNKDLLTQDITGGLPAVGSTVKAPQGTDIVGAYSTPLMASGRNARSDIANRSAKLDSKITQTTGVNPAPNGYGADGKPIQDPNAGGAPKQVGPSSLPQNGKATAETKQGEVQKAQDPYEKMMLDYSKTLEQSALDRKTADQDWQTRLDDTQKTLITSIEQKYAARRLKMEDINSRMLEGKRIAGISAGRQRYTPGHEESLLSTEELDGQSRLAGIDAEELSLIAQAKQQRDEKSYEAFVKSMDRVDELNKEKLGVITKLHENSIAQDKLIEDKRRNAITEEQATFNLQQDKATSFAKGAYDAIQGFNTQEEKDMYINELARKQAIDPELLRGSIDEYGTKQLEAGSKIASREATIARGEAGLSLREQSLKIQQDRLALQTEKQASGTVTEKKANAFSSINYLLSPDAQGNVTKKGGIPYVDINGYITPEGFKTLVSAATESGISRKEFLAEYGTQLYIEEGRAKAYGLTAQETKQLAGQTQSTSVIDKEFIKTTFPDLDTEDTMSKVEGYRKAGYTDKEIVALLNKA